MITSQHKQEIADALVKEHATLGSWQKVATKVDANVATVSSNMLKPEKWELVSETMWSKVAAKIGYKITNNYWSVVDTMNTQIVTSVLHDAQFEAMFMAISEKAGSGKTASIQRYKSLDVAGAVFVLQCEEWSKKQFLFRLCESLGVQTKSHDTADLLTERVVTFFKQKTKSVSPLLILDEADKLRPTALRFLIPLYNRLEDELGLVVAGTDYLKKNIQNGVRRSLKGYDEIDSRLGRAYVDLIGATKKDIVLICQANGIENEETIDAIWRESGPVQRSVQGKILDIVDDLRRVKRLVKRERLRSRIPLN
jgi:hypothetical protein